ncbi:hypothetical protein L208DRAFT_656663 [Tricholoma matsutake]|nr:hypothetical protein L208DRAFT_656663 [Tricholoma matsutake 945]
MCRCCSSNFRPTQHLSYTHIELAVHDAFTRSLVVCCILVGYCCSRVCCCRLILSMSHLLRINRTTIYLWRGYGHSYFDKRPDGRFHSCGFTGGRHG